jgi:hypothetical protein
VQIPRFARDDKAIFGAVYEREPLPHQYGLSNLPGANPGYDAFHAPRYQYLVKRLERDGLIGRDTKVLDIGPSRLTGMLRDRFGARVDTLGFDADSKSPVGDNYRFDLNRSHLVAGHARP